MMSFWDSWLETSKRQNIWRFRQGAICESGLHGTCVLAGLGAACWPTACFPPLQGFAGDDQLAEALKGADVVIMPAGVPRKPGMTRDDLFKVRPASPDFGFARRCLL